MLKHHKQKKIRELGFLTESSRRASTRAGKAQQQEQEVDGSHVHSHTGSREMEQEVRSGYKTANPANIDVLPPARPQLPMVP